MLDFTTDNYHSSDLHQNSSIKQFKTFDTSRGGAEPLRILNGVCSPQSYISMGKNQVIDRKISQCMFDEKFDQTETGTLHESICHNASKLQNKSVFSPFVENHSQAANIVIPIEMQNQENHMTSVS